MSSFAVFERWPGKCLGEGKTQDEAYSKACETLATAGVSDDRIYAEMVEYIGGDQDSSEVVLYPHIAKGVK